MRISDWISDVFSSDLFPDTRVAISTEKLGRGRKIIAEILDTPADLTARDAQNDVFVAVRDQMERFGFTRSNLYQDFHTCSFYSAPRIGQAYWSPLASPRRPQNQAEAKVPPASLHKQIKARAPLQRVVPPHQPH